MTRAPVLRDLPVFGICGHSGSGKTTVIERLLPVLTAEGLAVAVVKPGAHHLDVDREGKDSDRLFRAGADVYLEARDEALVRAHRAPSESAAGREPRRAARGGAMPGIARPAEVARSHDLVLVEGRRHLGCDHVWLRGPDERGPPAGGDRPLAVLPADTDRTAAVRAILRDWLPGQWRAPPVYGCVLIGGRSRRMGRPKHLLREDGTTWLQRGADALAAVADRVVVAGGGALPPATAEVTRLPDVPDVAGPLAGILACMRWAPWVTWLVTACDLPDLAPEALRWLRSTRRPGVWATLPRATADGPVEPLLAHYDFRAARLLEDLAAAGSLAPSAAADHAKVATPQVPARVAQAWANVNTAADLDRRRGREA
ncbi:MAG: molybdopterin-guanine dinucleotide biosynthesis protein MobB [Phycisphaerae bacterium]